MLVWKLSVSFITNLDIYGEGFIFTYTSQISVFDGIFVFDAIQAYRSCKNLRKNRPSINMV